MDVKQIDVGLIKAYAKNAKKHPEEQVKAIANSIREFGFRQPLVLDKNMEIIVGHGSLAAAKLLGMTAVPVVMADDLTEEQVKAFRLADNKTNESDWDFELLDLELSEIGNIDMSQFGFDLTDIDFDESDLDDESEKENVIVSINCGSVKNYEMIKERLQNICDEIGGSLAVKMA